MQGKETATIKGAGPSLSLGEEALILANKIKIFAEKGQLLLDKEARLNGETVKLNCDDEKAPPQKDDGEPIELEPFRTKLTDHGFKPHAGKTYHLVADGLRYEGKTTADGLVDKEIPKGAKAIEITVWLGDYPQGERRTSTCGAATRRLIRWRRRRRACRTSGTSGRAQRRHGRGDAGGAGELSA